MRNHFHLVVEIPNANLVAGMCSLLSSYTLRLNHGRKLFASLQGSKPATLEAD